MRNGFLSRKGEVIMAKEQKPREITFVAQGVDGTLKLIQWRTLSLCVETAWEEAKEHGRQEGSQYSFLNGEHPWDDPFLLIGAIQGKVAWIEGYIRKPTQADFEKAGRAALTGT
jgi:formylglycine-generating enzyme required for sulfatase activity